jgi:hypothetical protein
MAGSLTVIASFKEEHTFWLQKGSGTAQKRTPFN